MNSHLNLIWFQLANDDLKIYSLLHEIRSGFNCFIAQMEMVKFFPLIINSLNAIYVWVLWMKYITVQTTKSIQFSAFMDVILYTILHTLFANMSIFCRLNLLPSARLILHRYFDEQPENCFHSFWRRRLWMCNFTSRIGNEYWQCTWKRGHKHQMYSLFLERKNLILMTGT